MFQKMPIVGSGGGGEPQEDNYIEYTVGFGANGTGGACGGIVGSSSSASYIGYNGNKIKSAFSGNYFIVTALEDVTVDYWYMARGSVQPTVTTKTVTANSEITRMNYTQSGLHACFVGVHG